MNATVFASALVMLAPGADHLVRAYRDRWDPPAALGIPAHFTVLVPFLPLPAIAPPVAERLAALFAEHAPFDYALTELRRFPGVLYLAPEPAAPFQALTRSVVAAFPDCPPYGGKFDDIIPHLTLGEVADPAHLEQVAQDFQKECGPRLPLRLRAESVVLVDNLDGAWMERATFRLGG